VKVVAATVSAAETIETGAGRGECLYIGRRAVGASDMGHPFDSFGNGQGKTFAQGKLRASL
jgi:hypothetical protein